MWQTLHDLISAQLQNGRIDKRYEFPNANAESAYRMFLRFFPGCDAEAKKFGENISKSLTPYSMAMLQEHLIRHRNSSHSATELGLKGDF